MRVLASKAVKVFDSPNGVFEIGVGVCIAHDINLVAAAGTIIEHHRRLRMIRGSRAQEKITETNQQGVWGRCPAAIVLGQGQQLEVVPLTIEGFLAGTRIEIFIKLGRYDIVNKGHKAGMLLGERLERIELLIESLIG